MLKSQKSFSFSSPYLQPVQKSHTNKTLSQMYRDTRSWVLLLWSFERGRMLMCVSCSMTLKNSPHQINQHILDKRWEYTESKGSLITGTKWSTRVLIHLRVLFRLKIQIFKIMYQVANMLHMLVVITDMPRRSTIKMITSYSWVESQTLCQNSKSNPFVNHLGSSKSSCSKKIQIILTIIEATAFSNTLIPEQ